MMSEPFTLCTSTVVTPEEFEEVLKEMGATLLNPSRREWVISDGEKHVWVFLGESLEPKEYEDDPLVPVVRARLGGPPRTEVEMEVSRTEGSEHLAVEFACRCAERWPCVVDDCGDNVYTADDLRRLRDRGKGFEPAVSGEL